MCFNRFVRTDALHARYSFRRFPSSSGAIYLSQVARQPVTSKRHDLRDGQEKAVAILSGMIEELWRQRRPELVVIMGRGDQPWADGAEVQRHDLHDGQEKAAAILSGMIEEFSRQRRPELVVIMGRGDPPWARGS